jgi:hypothetical protein
MPSPRAFLALAAPVLAVAIVVALGLQMARTSGRFDPPPNASVVASTINVAPNGDSADVVLRVTAGPHDFGPLSIFWIVALPNVPRAWEAPRYVAPAQHLDSLAAGQTAELSWARTRLPLPAGRYDVTAWVHKVAPDASEEHLVGGLVGSFSISQQVPLALRLGEGWFEVTHGALMLQTINVEQVDPQSQTVNIEASIVNSSSQPVDGRAYWIVGRYTDTQPFLAPYWQSTSQLLPAMAPGESRTLSWQDSIGLTPGTYGVSLWVHIEDPVAGSRHSQSSINIPLVLQATQAHLLRHVPVEPLHFVSASFVRAGLLRVVMQNDGPPADVSLGVDLASESRRYDWYQSPAPPETQLGVGALDTSAQQTLDVPVPVDCSPDRSLARLRLYGGAPSSPKVDWGEDVLADTCPA